MITFYYFLFLCFSFLFCSFCFCQLTGHLFCYFGFLSFFCCFSVFVFSSFFFCQKYIILLDSRASKSKRIKMIVKAKIFKYHLNYNILMKNINIKIRQNSAALNKLQKQQTYINDEKSRSHVLDSWSDDTFTWLRRLTSNNNSRYYTIT